MVHLFLRGKEGVNFWPKWRYVIYEQPLAFQVTISLTTTVANLLKSLLMEILIKYEFKGLSNITCGIQVNLDECVCTLNLM